MKLTRYFATVLILLAGLALAACEEDEVERASLAQFDFFVDAATGSDANPGTSAAPFKTITMALGVAVAGEAIKVRPGTYDAVNGEVFPLLVPGGVTLIGDEANKGSGVPAVLIAGTGDGFEPGTGAVVAGFLVKGAFLKGFNLINNAVTVRNNTITGTSFGLWFDFASQNHIIIGNDSSGNSSHGVVFVGSAGPGSRFESNTFKSNVLGVEYDNPGGDMGGGATGSLGGNEFSCNSRNDIWSVTGLTIDAQNNFWDHPAPTSEPIESNLGVDLYTSMGTVTYNTAGSAVVASPCP